MYWLDNDSGVTTPPAIPPVVSTTRQYFTEGGGGVQPSIPGGEWFNMMTDEILAVLDEAGIAPDKASHAQLLAAITAMFVNKSGDTMSGPLALASGSTVPNPATGTRSTALATMQMFAAEFGVSLAASGYQKLPSGLIIQWGAATYVGTVASDGTATADFTFPIAFPNATIEVISSLAAAAYGKGGSTYVRSLNGNTGGTMSFWNAPANGTWGSVSARYMAIGY